MARDVSYVIARAIVQAMSEPAWATSVASPEERAWILLLALSKALHPLGPMTVPAPAAIRRHIDRIERDEQIRREFNGRNYGALAEQYGLTTRQIRRITDLRRRQTHP